MLWILASHLLLAQPRNFPAAKTGGNYMFNYYLPPPSSTPWRPCWSPDGRTIAFSMAGSIWKIEVGRFTAFELTANRTYDSSPAWSPDGRWIVYTADDDSRSINLMLLNVATGESMPLTSGTHVNVDPVWSRDGKKLAYVSTDPDGRFNVFYMPFENGRAGTPVRITSDSRFGRERPYLGDYDLHIQPSWSPDGKEMLLTSNRGIPRGSGALWRVPVEPDAMQKGRKILQEETLYRTRAQWSPDGGRIIYSSYQASQFNHLWLMPPNGGESYQLNFGDWDSFEPAWSPDGEWVVYVSNQGGLSQLHLLKVFGGEDKPIRILRRTYRRQMANLHVEIVDAETGRPVPARVYLKASDGKTYAPDNAYHRQNKRSGEHFFQSTGHFQVELPSGEAELRVMRGFEYVPVTRTVTLKTEPNLGIRVALQRFTDLKRKGWFNGTNHTHMNYGGNLRNNPEHMLFMAAAEDNDVIGEQICNKDLRVFDHQYFTGKPDVRSTSERILFFGQEYRPLFYNHISFMNLTKYLISPFTTAYEGTALESLYPTNTDMFRLAHAQGAIGGYVHPWGGDPERSGFHGAGGYPVDLALGQIDYLELSAGTGRSGAEEVWHHSLNCGFKVSATAGEDSILDLYRTDVLGADRTYAYLGEKLDWSRWVEALRSGKTFVTNGPLIRFSVNGELPGGEIRLPAGGGSVNVEALLESLAEVKRLEVLVNGKVVEAIPLQAGGKRANWRGTIPIAKSGYLVLRASGDVPLEPLMDQRAPSAISGAVYVVCGDRPVRSRASAEYFVRWIDSLTKDAAAHPAWRSERERQHVLEQFAQARKVFEQRAQEAE